MDNVTIPRIQKSGKAIVVTHPCSMRGKNGLLKDTVLMAAVGSREPIDKEKWTNGFLVFYIISATGLQLKNIQVFTKITHDNKNVIK